MDRRVDPLQRAGCQRAEPAAEVSLLIGVVCRQFAHDDHEVFLNRLQLVAHDSGGVDRLGLAERGVEFVQPPDRFDARVALRDALPENQAGRAVVAGTCCDGCHNFSASLPCQQEPQGTAAPLPDDTLSVFQT